MGCGLCLSIQLIGIHRITCIFTDLTLSPQSGDCPAFTLDLIYQMEESGSSVNAPLNEVPKKPESGVDVELVMYGGGFF